eukprot:3279521-Rhodomonas_salina.2
MKFNQDIPAQCRLRKKAVGLGSVMSSREVVMPCSDGHVTHAPTVTSRMLLQSRHECSYAHVTYDPTVTSPAV